MAVDPTVELTEQPYAMAAASGVKAGDLVYHNGTRLAKADADALTSPAQYVVVAGQAFADDDKVFVSHKATFTDADLSLTITPTGCVLYLDTTAGGFTQTRPTGAADLRQVVGRALTTTKYTIEIKAPYELPVTGFLMETNTAEGPGIETTAGTPLAVALDSGRFEGYGLDGQNEYVTFGIRVPENAIGLATNGAKIHCAEEADPGGTPTVSISVSSAVHDETQDTVEDATETTKDIFSAGTADDIADYDMSAAFNATNCIRPGALMAVKLLKADSGSDEFIVFGITLTFLCV